MLWMLGPPLMQAPQEFTGVEVSSFPTELTLSDESMDPVTVLFALDLDNISEFV